MSSISEKTQFDFLFDALARKYPGIQNINRQNINSMFQFATTPIAARWESGTDAEVYELANAGSSNLEGFYVKGEAIDRSYKSLIQSIKPMSGDANPRYRQITAILNNICDALAAKLIEAQSAYNVWAANNTDAGSGTPAKPFEIWLTDRFGGIAYYYAIEDYERQRNGYMKEQSEILAAMGDPLKEASELLNSDRMHTMTISKDGQQARKVPYVSISGMLAKDRLAWSLRKEGEYDLNETFNSRSAIKNKWVTVKRSKVRRKCFRASIQKKIITSETVPDEEYTLKIKIVGLGSYNITRGDWFMPAFVNPNIELVEGSRFSNDTFFGRNGYLHLLPENLLVAYKPSFEITVPTKSFQQEFGTYIDKKLDWFEMFGFRADLGPSKMIKPITQGTETKMIFNTTANDSPQIMGVTSKLVYNGHE